MYSPDSNRQLEANLTSVQIKRPFQHLLQQEANAVFAEGCKQRVTRQPRHMWDSQHWQQYGANKSQQGVPVSSTIVGHHGLLTALHHSRKENPEMSLRESDQPYRTLIRILMSTKYDSI